MPFHYDPPRIGDGLRARSYKPYCFYSMEAGWKRQFTFFLTLVTLTFEPVHDIIMVIECAIVPMVQPTE